MLAAVVRLRMREAGNVTPRRLTPPPRERAPSRAAQVRAKTFVAVGHETANNRGKRALGGKGEAMDADLLANMELGVHAPAAGPPAPVAGAAGAARAAPGGGAGAGAPPDSPTDAAGGDLYFRGASLPDDDGIELSSAPVRTI
jgi:hypothetical protein